jgi:hypothetical protein
MPEGESRLPRIALIGAGAAALAALALYLRTLHPGVGPSLDSMELQIAVLVDGVIHPPGSPQYLLLGKLAMAVFPGANRAYRLNLLSALAAGITIGFVFLLTYRLVSRPGKTWQSLAISGFAAMSLAIAPRLWYQASIAELYALNALYVASVSYFLLTWNQTKKGSAFWAAMALYALSFGNHTSMILLLPMVALAVVLTDPSVLFRPRTMIVVVLLVIASAAQYAIIPLRAGANAPFCNFCPSMAGLPSYLTGGGFKHAFFALPKREIVARLPESIGQANVQFMPWGYALGVIGLWELLRKNRQIAWVWIVGLAAEYVFVISYAIPDWHDFLTPCYVLFAPLIGYGVMRLLEAAFPPASQQPTWMRTTGSALTALAGAASVGITLLANLPVVDQSNLTQFGIESHALLEGASPGAWLIMPSPNSAAYYYSWAVRYTAFAEQIGEFSAIAPPELDPPPGPPPAYRSWASIAERLSTQGLVQEPKQVFLVDASDPRAADYALVPICVQGTDVIAGYEVVGVIDGNAIVPLVTSERWARIQNAAIRAGEAAHCPAN